MSSFLKNKNGFGLIEVMVVSAIMLVIGLGMSQLLTNAVMTQKGIQAKDMQRDLLNELRFLLSDPAACLNSLGPANGGNPGVVTGYDVNTLRNAVNAVKHTVGDVDPSGFVSYTQFHAGNWDPNIAGGSAGIFSLRVTLTKRGRVIGAPVMVQSIPIQATINTTNNRVLSCSYNGTSGEGLWVRTILDPDNIYYNAGTVGVGTTNATTLFQIGNSAFFGSGGVNGVQSTGSDILFNLTGSLAAEADMILNIDADNDQTNRSFIIQKDSLTASGVELMRVDENGEVGIGTSSPDRLFHVHGEMLSTGGGSVAGNGAISFADSATGTAANIASVYGFGGGLVLSGQNPANNVPHVFVSNIGNIGIGTTNPLEKVEVIGNVVAEAFFWSSDMRKKIITSHAPGLEVLRLLNGYQYVWKDTYRADVGVIAQEVERVLPALVTHDSSGSKHVNYAGLIAPIIEATKELDVKQHSLEQRLAEVELQLQRIQRECHKADDTKSIKK